MKQNIINIARKNINYLEGHQVKNGFDKGGIKDPALDRVIGDNYATEEFAFGLSSLIAMGEVEDLQDSFVEAMNFHKRTTESYSFGTHSEHYQHRRIGFIEAYNLSKEFYDEELVNEWKSVIESWSWKNTSNCNWYAMNALLCYLIYSETGQTRFQLYAWGEIARTVKYRGSDSYFSDNFDSVDFKQVSPHYNPVAYHAYTTALLHRYWLSSGSRVIRRIFLKSAKILHKLILSNGHVAYRGRSSGHIFTYGVGYYVMIAAAKETNKCKYLDKSKEILGTLKFYQKSDGSWPVVANTNAYDRVDFQAPYSYHSVYNAHCSAWLLRSVPLFKSISIDDVSKDLNTDTSATSIGGGLYLIKKANYEAVLSTGSGGNHDSAFSIAMLDINGNIGVLPSPASENSPVSGNFCRIMRSGHQIWSSIRKKGEFGKITDYEVIGSKSIQIANSELNWRRKFSFQESEIIISDEISSDEFPLRECTLQTGYSIPKDSTISMSSPSESFDKLSNTVLGNGSTRITEGRRVSNRILKTKLILDL
ncbi:hypothetical protein ACFQE1_01060 [Halobium palmae]|uniref:Uncharacterized protein n=1 Tax=Halobium palmae TaxID=1776492 RepID=A0ABD5RUT7_9EURY